MIGQALLTRLQTQHALAVILLSGCLLFVLPIPIQAQLYDLLLKDGHMIDPKNGIDAPMDIAIAERKIARVAVDIPESGAGQVVDVSGLYITPGLIDIHSHNYYGTEPHSAYSNGFNALPPDGFTFRAGVTTVVDVGGSGWRNFRHFKEQVIERSQTRVLAFLNIVGRGMKGGVIEQNLNDMDPKMTALVANRNEEIVGVKIAHYSGHEWEPYHQAVKAAELAGIPVMVDFGGANPPLPLKTLLLEVLRPGDIYTHAFSQPGSSRQAIVDGNGNPRPGMLEAQKRGIIFDVGHGQASFAYSVAVPAFEQGLWPNTISTDIHRNSMNAGMKDMSNLMSKLLNLGMTLQEVIEASTWTPAQAIQREDLGHLSKGAVADIAVFNLRKGDFGFLDAHGYLKTGNQKLEAELTVRAGDIVWDLNGLAASVWSE